MKSWMTILVLGGAALLPPVVSAQGTTSFRPGARLRGALEEPGEIDGWVFGAMEGSQLTFSVKGKKGLRPSVALRNLNTGAVVDLSGSLKTKKKAATVKNFTIQATGQYRFEISAAEGTVGDYAVASRIKLSKKLANTTSSGSTQDDLIFDAAPGMRPRLVILHGQVSWSTAYALTTVFARDLGDVWRSRALIPSHPSPLMEVDRGAPHPPRLHARPDALDVSGLRPLDATPVCFPETQMLRVDTSRRRNPTPEENA